MRIIHSVVIREKLPSKRPRKQSSYQLLTILGELQRKSHRILSHLPYKFSLSHRFQSTVYGMYETIM